MNLKEIKQLSEDRWKCDDKDYPPLARTVGVDDKKLFTLNHILIHLQKNIGAIAGLTEPLGHGEAFDREKAIIELRKVIVNALQYADTAGITPEEIEKEILAWASDKNRR